MIVASAPTSVRDVKNAIRPNRRIDIPDDICEGDSPLAECSAAANESTRIDDRLKFCFCCLHGFVKPFQDGVSTDSYHAGIIRMILPIPNRSKNLNA
jgi:hypothetical protein